VEKRTGVKHPSRLTALSEIESSSRLLRSGHSHFEPRRWSREG